MAAISHKVPPLKLVTFKEERRPFLSPRGTSSGLAHFTPRSQMDSESDACLQGVVEKAWRGILEQIEAIARTQAAYVVEIPYSQGLLFGELLSTHPAIERTTADKVGKLTMFFRNSLNRNENYIEHESFQISSEASLKGRSIAYFPSESINYLRKFLEISNKMLHCEEGKVTIPASGFDREFFKAALFHHYPNYVQSIASKRKHCGLGRLEITFLKNKHTQKDLIEKIKRLKKLVKHSESCAFISSEASLRYTDPTRLEENSLFLRRKSVETASDSSPTLLSDTKSLCEKDTLDLQGDFITPLFRAQDMEIETLSDRDLDENRTGTEYENWATMQLMQLIKDQLKGVVPKKTHSEDWKALWRQVEGPKQPSLNQVKIRELVSLKLRLQEAAFDLPIYLNKSQELENLSKEDQMHLISEAEIIRTIYPDAVDEPAVNLIVNNMPLIFEKTPFDGTSANARACFRKLLAALLSAQHRYNEENLEQLSEDLFPTSTTAHRHLFPDFLIFSMLQAVSFGFGANAFFFLRDGLLPFLKDYSIKSNQGRTPTCEFFINCYGNYQAVRTAAFTLYKNHEERGYFVTKLISSFSFARKSWSYKLEIPAFVPSSACSLSEQKRIHEKLLLLARPPR